MADEESVWVEALDDCEQGPLGFSGDDAWVAGVARPLARDMAALLTRGEGSRFRIVPQPGPEPAPIVEPAPYVAPAQVAEAAPVSLEETSL